MKKNLLIYFSTLAFLLLFSFSSNVFAQLAEWRLVKTTYSSVDPDGVGPAIGSVQFAFEIHAQSGSFVAKEISTGFSWQSTKAMLPTGAACTGGPPSNIVVSPQFGVGGAGYSYTSVNQCNIVATPASDQIFDRTAAGTLDPGSGAITLTTAWVPAFTVTLWALDGTPLGVGKEAGYGMLHSSGSGTPGPLGSYAIADDGGNEVPANSLSFSTPLALGSGTPLPVLFTKFDARCVDKGAMVIWGTATESNSSHFEVERSTTGFDWVTIGNIRSAGTTTIPKNYQYLDLNGGNAFYRLQQVDLDGRKTYTAAVHVNCQGKQVTVVLYPVPVKDKLNVVIKSGKLFKTELQVFDISGKIVKRVPTTINIGNNSITINVNTLAAGEYILRSTEPTIQINKKFVIAR